MTNGLFDRLERWPPTLLLLGGAMAVVFASLFAVEAVRDTTVSTGMAAGIAFTLAFVGLLGLHPSLVDQSPWLARLGSICAALGALGFASLFLVDAATVVGLLPTPEPDWLAVLNLPRIIGLIPGFVLFAAASLRSDIHARSVGLFLLLPAVAFSVNFAAVVAAGESGLSPWWAFGITLGEAVGLLGAGYRLREGTLTTDSAAATSVSGGDG